MRRIAVSAVAISLVVPAAEVGSATARRPNILVVVTDDVRTEGMDVMPATRRWLGGGGTTFTEAYVTTPLCCPSRASILSGRYAHNPGVRTNSDGHRLDQDTTLAARLARARYRNAIAGKFLLFWDLERPPPHFDRYAITNGTRYHGDAFSIDGRIRRVEQYSTSFIGDTARRYLGEFEADDDQPWFVYVAVQAAHSPFVADERHREARVPRWEPGPAVPEEDRSDKPAFVRRHHFSRDRAAEFRRAQLRTLISVDEMMDKLRRELMRLGEEQDTLVVFTSDNGYQWGEHGLRSKGLPYTESIKVPLLVRWPGRIPAGRIDDRLVSLADIAATAAEAAGSEAQGQPPLDGRSLLGEGRRRQLLVEYAEDRFFPYPTWALLRGADFQYVEYFDGDRGRAVFREYYDLASDPAQLDNLLGDDETANDPARAERLSADLARARRCGGSACP
ncbi:MAG: sulfatase-like hydrolase/transferase [Acidimicrobiia bacterium]